MESTGQPEMIQVSEDYKLALDKHYPEFQMTLRGKTEIKVWIRGPKWETKNGTQRVQNTNYD